MVAVPALVGHDDHVPATHKNGQGKVALEHTAEEEDGRTSEIDRHDGFLHCMLGVVDVTRHVAPHRVVVHNRRLRVDGLAH